MNISTAGLISVNAGISVINSTADIRGEARSGSHATPVGLYATANLGQSSGGIEFRHSNGTQGVDFGYNSVYAAGSNTNKDLNFYSKGSGIIYAQSAMTCSSTLTSSGLLTANAGISIAVSGGGATTISQRSSYTNQPLIQLKGNVSANYSCTCTDGNLTFFNTSNSNGNPSGGWMYQQLNANVWSSGSDRRVKSVIETLDCGDCCEKLMKINCCSYYWKSDEKKERKNRGFIADEVKKVFPEFVSESGMKADDGESNLEGVSYMEFIPILVSAFQHMAEKAVNLEKENKLLLNILQDQKNQLAELRAVVFPPNALDYTLHHQP